MHPLVENLHYLADATDPAHLAKLKAEMQAAYQAKDEAEKKLAAALRIKAAWNATYAALNSEVQRAKEKNDHLFRVSQAIRAMHGDHSKEASKALADLRVASAEHSAAMEKRWEFTTDKNNSVDLLELEHDLSNSMREKSLAIRAYQLAVAGKVKKDDRANFD